MHIKWKGVIKITYFTDKQFKSFEGNTSRFGYKRDRKKDSRRKRIRM